METANWVTALASGVVASAFTLAMKHWLDVLAEKKQLAHRVQFEAEYQIYRELWPDIEALARRALELRPVLEYVDPKESNEDRRRRKIGAFVDAHNKAIHTFGDRRPFYADAVFEACKELRDVTYQEWGGYKLFEPGESQACLEKASEVADRIQDQTNAICDAIRKRIKEMEVRA